MKCALILENHEASRELLLEDVKSEEIYLKQKDKVKKMKYIRVQKL